MNTGDAAPTYRVWGADNIAYGPVELSTLAAWAKEERITAESWVFVDSLNRWIKAAELPELDTVIQAPATEVTSLASTEASGLKLGMLRRLKLLATMDERQLTSFVRYLEVIRYQQFSLVVRAGDPGDAMFLILEGELRARVMVDGKETTLTTMTVGDFFGEISLLDQGPRSADVVANHDSVLLKITMTAFNRMLAEAPALAAPFLYNLGRSAVGRIRILTKKYQDSIHFSRTAAGGH
jgi:hypothetical protein